MVRCDLGRYLTQIKQKSDNTLVIQAYLYEINHSQNRISIENTAKKELMII